jgi:hypothetical protein
LGALEAERRNEFCAEAAQMFPMQENHPMFAQPDLALILPETQKPS